MQSKLISPFYIIFGGGHFGKKAFDYLHNKGHILVLDNSPQCLLNKCINSIGLHEFINNLEKTGSSSDFFEYFINGDISTMLTVLKQKMPDYLVPTAPTHIMKELCEKYLEIMGLSNTMTNKIEEFQIDRLPENLHIKDHKSTTYLSYNKFDQICPEECIGPPDYCPYQHINKPLTVSKYVENILGKKNLLLFKSTQLTAGLGGIKGSTISNNKKILQNAIETNKHTEFDLFIATTCNCHGVVDKIRIQKRKEKSV